MYQMPIKAIKNILLKEHNSYMSSIRERVYRIEYNTYLLDVADGETIGRIQVCETYEQLNDFISESRRMSLEEWINSL